MQFERNTMVPSPVIVKPLARELQEQCHIYLDEQLYLSAIYLLRSSLEPSFGENVIHIPPPSLLALLCNLVVQPSVTQLCQKRGNSELREVPSLCIAYLYDLLAVAGPIKADFHRSFLFHSQLVRDRGGREYVGGDKGDYTIVTGNGFPDDHFDDLLSHGRSVDEWGHTNRTRESLLWYKGQDFWSVVGWIFNCSVVYPYRWVVWKVWLEFMTDVLQRDWKLRSEPAVETNYEQQNAESIPTSSTKDDQFQDSIRQSLLMVYTLSRVNRTSGIKHLLKAIFANGNLNCMCTFPEVFNSEIETPERKRKRPAQSPHPMRERGETDAFGPTIGKSLSHLNKYDFDPEAEGDENYYSDEGENTSSSLPTSTKPEVMAKRIRNQKRDTIGEYTGNSGFRVVDDYVDDTDHDRYLMPGEIQSVPFRQRLLSLLLTASADLAPYDMFILPSELISHINNIIKSLSLYHFILHTSFQYTALTQEQHVRLLWELLPLYSSAPATSTTLDLQAGRLGATSQSVLETFMSSSATTILVEENAKLSILLEQFLIAAFHLDLIRNSKSTETAVRIGIAAREKKARPRRTTKDRIVLSDQRALELLNRSSQTLGLLISL